MNQRLSLGDAKDS